MDLLVGLSKVKLETGKAASGAIRGAIAGSIVGSVLGLFGAVFVVKDNETKIPICYLRGTQTINIEDIPILQDLMNTDDIGILFEFRLRDETAWNESAMYIQRIINMYKAFLSTGGSSSAADVSKLISYSIKCTKALSKLHAAILSTSKIEAEAFKTASMNFHLMTEEMINKFRKSGAFQPVILKR